MSFWYPTLQGLCYQKATGKQEHIRQVWGKVENPVHDQSRRWTDKVEP